jgi:hypothetical protein
MFQLREEMLLREKNKDQHHAFRQVAKFPLTYCLALDIVTLWHIWIQPYNEF